MNLFVFFRAFRGQQQFLGLSDNEKSPDLRSYQAGRDIDRQAENGDIK